MKKFISILLALSLVLGIYTALAEGEDPVLASVNGVQITKSRVESVLPSLVNRQLIEGEADYENAINFLIEEEILKAKIKEMKFDVFTKEEESAFLKDAQAEWDQAVEQYVKYNLSEDSDKAREEARKKGNEFYTSRGYSVELLQKGLQQKAAFERLSEHLIGGYKPTNEEIQQVFDKMGAVYKQKYENDIQTYEYETMYNNQKSWYTPEGYRGILHILLPVDKDILNRYTTTQAAFEEQNSAEGGEKKENSGEKVEKVTEEDLKAARQAVLDSKKTELADIYSRLEKGEVFLKLLNEYGADPGMTNSKRQLEGYPVNKNSVIYDPAFTKGAFSEKLQKPGDYSDPIISNFGIHIMYYLKDVQSGLNMTDEIYDEISQLLISQKKDAALEEAFKKWKETMEIKKFDDEIAKAKAEAIERIKQNEKNAVDENKTLETSPASENDANSEQHTNENNGEQQPENSNQNENNEQQTENNAEQTENKGK